MIRFAKNIPLAALLMAGVLAISWSASRAIQGPAHAVAHALQRADARTAAAP